MSIEAQQKMLTGQSMTQEELLETAAEIIAEGLRLLEARMEEDGVWDSEVYQASFSRSWLTQFKR